MYRIEQREPDGWLYAYAVLFADKVVANFRFRDSAEHYIKCHVSED